MKFKKYPLAALASVLLLSGCAAWKLDKSLTPDPAQVQRVAREVAKSREFQQAVFEVSTFAVDRCALKVRREPFALMTVGNLVGFYDEKKIAAYWHAAGFDETWRVLWAADGSGLRPGQRVMAINGNAIENNKSWQGEAPLAPYFTYTSRARDAAGEGRPYEITLEDGRTLTVAAQPACRTLVWSMPVVEDDASFEVSPGVHGATVLPPNALHEARSADELRYLAALAVYYTASESGAARARGGRMLMGLGALGAFGAIATAPLVGIVANPLIAATVNSGAGALTRGSEGAQAAAFASKVVADMGGDASAGLALAERIEARAIKAPGVALSAQDRQWVRAALGLAAR